MADYEHIDVHKVGGNIGAEIRGVRISADLAPEVVAEIRRALLRHRVVFVRTSTTSTTIFSAVSPSCSGPSPKPPDRRRRRGNSDPPDRLRVTQGNAWHTDVTFVDRIPAISFLRVISLPPYGGTTVSPNTVRAYRAAEPVRRRRSTDEPRRLPFQPLRLRPRRRAGGQRSAGVLIQGGAYQRGVPRARRSRPGIRSSASTRRPVSARWYSGHFVRRFVGLERRRLGCISFDASPAAHHQPREHGSLELAGGDIAIWDTRATQHYAVDDYDDLPRRLHRVTLAGDIPVSIDGIASVVRKGDASEFSPVAEAAAVG